MKYSRILRLGIAAILAFGIPFSSIAKDKHKNRGHKNYNKKNYYKSSRYYRGYPQWKYRDARRYYRPWPYFGVTIAPIYSGRSWRGTAYSLEAAVQIQLREYGYYWGPIDGIIGPESRRAIWRFQADYGLRPTGTINGPTLDRLGLL